LLKDPILRVFLNRPNSEIGLRKVPVSQHQRSASQSEGLRKSHPSIVRRRALNAEMKTNEVMLLRQRTSNKPAPGLRVGLDGRLTMRAGL
jgi:hypothetical protein